MSILFNVFVLVVNTFFAGMANERGRDWVFWVNAVCAIANLVCIVLWVAKR